MNEHAEDVQERGLVATQPREIINVEQAVAEWKLYQELTQKLLDESDYQKIGQARFKKKSAWRKYAKAFNISCSLVKEEILRADDGFPIFARVWARAEEPSGRFQVSDGEYHITERCCPAATGEDCGKKRKQTWHECCSSTCDGRKHQSHPGDVAATATTRAKNRAISDLIGAGEVSAEEAEVRNGEPEASPRRANGPAQRSFEATPPEPPARRAKASKAVEGGGGVTEQQCAAIYTLLGNVYPKDEEEQFKYVERVQPKAVNGTKVTLTPLTFDEGSEMIKELQAIAD